MDNIKGASESPDDNVVIKKPGTFIIPGGGRVVTDANGNKSVVPTTLSQAGGAATVPWAKGAFVYWTGAGSSASQGIYVPKHVSLYHEVGGHVYYRFTIQDPKQGTRTIDYENSIRKLLNLKQRGYDDAHRP